MVKKIIGFDKLLEISAWLITTSRGFEALQDKKASEVVSVVDVKPGIVRVKNKATGTMYQVKRGERNGSPCLYIAGLSPARRFYLDTVGSPVIKF